jgi:hypothetical protein
MTPGDIDDTIGSARELGRRAWVTNGSAFAGFKSGIAQLEYRLFRAMSVDNDVVFAVQEHPANH